MILRPISATGVIVLTILLGLPALCDTAKESAAPPATPSATLASAQNKSGFSWLTNPDALQEKVIEELMKRVGERVTLPEVPPNQLLDWYRSRHVGAADAVTPEEQRRRLILRCEELMVAHQLLSSSRVEERRRGLLLISILWPAVAAHETYAPKLPVSIVEAFLLPYWNDGYREDWKMLSRVQILQNASAVYEGAKMDEKTIEVTQKLVEVAQQDDSYVADWARFKLAPLLAAHDQKSRAIELLEALSSPSLQAGAAPLLQRLRAEVKNDRK